jgi:hypothetical protein
MYYYSYDLLLKTEWCNETVNPWDARTDSEEEIGKLAGQVKDWYFFLRSSGCYWRLGMEVN